MQDLPAAEHMTKKALIKSYGCQMNVYDGGRMADALAHSGYDETSNAEDADLIVLNTCHIREKATEKIYSELGRYKKLKSGNPDLRIVVAGCVAQAEGEEIIRRQPLVDVVVGPQTYHRLPELVAGTVDGSRRVDTEFPLESKFDRLPESIGPRASPSAFLTVQEGCDKFCTFCVVPYTRGAEISRPVERVLEEARRLVDRGACEITLLGQNVNAYHGRGPDGCEWTLAGLITALAEIEGLERIRFTTSHPTDMTDDLVAAHADCPKLMPYLHLPVQSGSDRILKKMNRRYTSAQYLEVVGRIRSARPDIMLSSDFIVGFPEENEADFEETLELVRTVGFGQSYSFKYSARPGTPAAERRQVPSEVAGERLQRLQTLLKQQQRDAQDAMVGRELSVLFERSGRRSGQLAGKSEYLHAVHADGGQEMMGRIGKVRISRSEPNSLSGVLIAA